jgi:hypothetical protein
MSAILRSLGIYLQLWIATAIQYTFRQLEKFAMIPANTRPRTSPTIKPESVILMDFARILLGARSAVQGMQI